MTVICEVCGAEMKRVEHNHLAKHGWTLSQYKDAFPNSPMISPSVRAKFSTNKLSYWVEKHGDIEGKKKYEEYRQMLKDKNSFEYMHAKKGMSREEYDAYNANRATTRENMIRRHGKVEGTKRWNRYVERQRVAGVTLQYFTDKYGQKEGSRIWRRLCNQKRNTLEAFISRANGDKEEGKRRYEEYMQKRLQPGIGVSDMQLRFQSRLDEELKNRGWNTQHAGSGKEVMLVESGINWLFDYTVVDLKAVIEFNGDYWHCNPQQYEPDFWHPHMQQSAQSIWDKDKNKLDAATRAGYHTKVVWESDWKEDADQVIASCVEWLDDLHNGTLR